MLTQYQGRLHSMMVWMREAQMAVTYGHAVNAHLRILSLWSCVQCVVQVKLNLATAPPPGNVLSVPSSTPNSSTLVVSANVHETVHQRHLKRLPQNRGAAVSARSSTKERPNVVCVGRPKAAAVAARSFAHSPRYAYPLQLWPVLQ